MADTKPVVVKPVKILVKKIVIKVYDDGSCVVT